MKPTEFELQLLRSAGGDVPSTEQRRQNRAAVMQAAGFATAGAGAAATASVAKASVTAAKSAKVVAAGSSIAIAKLSLLAVVGVVGAGGIFAFSRHRVDAPPASPIVIPAPPTVVASSSSTAEAPASLEDSNASRSAAEHATSPASTRTPRTAPPRHELSDSLAIETELLDTARQCLTGGDVTCASRKLAEHRSRFPRGTLASEAALLGIEAARASGDNAGALRIAEELLRLNSSGPYARRAKTIIDELQTQSK